MVMSIAYALAAYPAGVLSDIGGRFGVLFAGIVMLIAADVVLALAPDIGWVMVGTVLWGLHMGFTQGLLSALVADTAPAELRGTAFGAFHMLTGVALLAASLIAGALWDGLGPRATFVASALFAALALIGIVAIRSRITAPGQRS
jgi:MFS family permease